MLDFVNVKLFLADVQKKESIEVTEYIDKLLEYKLLNSILNSLEIREEYINSNIYSVFVHGNLLLDSIMINDFKNNYMNRSYLLIQILSTNMKLLTEIIASFNFNILKNMNMDEYDKIKIIPKVNSIRDLGINKYSSLNGRESLCTYMNNYYYNGVLFGAIEQTHVNLSFQYSINKEQMEQKLSEINSMDKVKLINHLIYVMGKEIEKYDKQKTIN